MISKGGLLPKIFAIVENLLDYIDISLDVSILVELLVF